MGGFVLIFRIDMGTLFDNFFMVAQASAEHNIFTYFADSNFAGKVIVLLLIAFSIIAWSVMLGKYAELEALSRANRLSEKTLANSQSVLEGAINNARKLSGPYASLLREAVVAWSRYEKSEAGSSQLSLRMGLVENALQRAISRQLIRYESKMILLGSIISGAPFLGLLGTSWGVMDSFGAMTGQASATLQMLAPGVSGALLTTVFGLFVAIPSVFGYNFLLAKVKSMVTELENFASSLADRIELESKISAKSDDDNDDEDEFELKPISVKSENLDDE